MTAFLSRLTWQDFAAITVGWCLIAVALATVPHRAKRAFHAADPGEEYVPPPQSWIDFVSVDALSDCDPVLHQRFYALVDTESWFGGAL